MNIKLSLHAIILILILISCENLNDIGSLDTDYSVFINLSVNQDKQEFYTYRTLPIDTAINGYPFGSNDEFFIDHPYLSFTDENGNVFDSFILEQRPEGYINRKYITNTPLFNVLPETVYKVFIQMDNVSIESSVKSLPKFNALKIEYGSEEFDADYYITPVTLSWEKLTNAKYYVLERIHYYTFVFDDSTTYSTSSGKLTDFYFTDQNSYSKWFNISSLSDSLSIKVTAYDIHLFKHYFEKNDQVNITNAYGYVGSSSVVDTLIRFR